MGLSIGNFPNNLNNKQNIIDPRVSLQWMVANDFRIRRIHRALQFYQKLYMKPLIDTFVGEFLEAKKRLKRNLLAHLNQAFGKMCESLCNRIHFDVLTDPKECAQIVSHSNFTSIIIIDSTMVFLHRRIKEMLFE